MMCHDKCMEKNIHFTGMKPRLSNVKPSFKVAKVLVSPNIVLFQLILTNVLFL